MDSPSRTDAKKDQFVGNIKETVGHAVGNESLETRGKAQHGSGMVEETMANVSGYMQGAYNTVSGTVQGVAGAFTGNTSQEASGKVEKKKGQAEKEFKS